MTILDEIGALLSGCNVDHIIREKLMSFVQHYGRIRYEQGVHDTQTVIKVDKSSLDYTEGYESGRAKGTNDGIQQVINWVNRQTTIPLDVKQAVKQQFGGE